ncbi:MAG TPA: carbon-nitrogen hydrolase family protein [archaeon]|nr:carbon-nitrogen hydrolase family protein [archaeon]
MGTNPRRRNKLKASVAVVLSDRYPYPEALERLRAWVEEAQRAGAGYICFPEYYFDRDRKEDGSLSRGARLDGPLAAELTALARRCRVAVAVGITEKVRNRRFPLWDFYNTALFVDWKGLRGTQRKVFLWVDPEWSDERTGKANEGDADYPCPPVCDERRRYLPGWSFNSFRFGNLQRACGLVCADGLMPPAWSHIIPQSPQIVFYLNGRVNLLKKWGPDLARISRDYCVPIAASNSFTESEAGIFDSDGRCVARLEGREGIAVAEVTLGGRQKFKPVRIRHWEGEPGEMLERLDKW